MRKKPKNEGASSLEVFPPTQRSTRSKMKTQFAHQGRNVSLTLPFNGVQRLHLHRVLIFFIFVENSAMGKLPSLQDTARLLPSRRSVACKEGNIWVRSCVRAVRKCVLEPFSLSCVLTFLLSHFFTFSLLHFLTFHVLTFGLSHFFTFSFSRPHPYFLTFSLLTVSLSLSHSLTYSLHTHTLSLQSFL